MQKKNTTHKVLLALAVLLFVLFAVFNYTGRGDIAPPMLIIALIALAVAVRGFALFRGFSYSLWIFTAVAVSMYYPRFFLSVGDFELKGLIVPLLQIIMFGMGSQMSLNDFAGVVKMPKGVIAGVLCQFTIMPIVGVSLAMVFNFPPEIAAGIILVGSSPSGLASNVMSFLARANRFIRFLIFQPRLKIKMVIELPFNKTFKLVYRIGSTERMRIGHNPDSFNLVIRSKLGNLNRKSIIELSFPVSFRRPGA